VTFTATGHRAGRRSRGRHGLGSSTTRLLPRWRTLRRRHASSPPVACWGRTHSVTGTTAATALSVFQLGPPEPNGPAEYTATTISTSASSVYYTQSVTFTANVARADPGRGTGHRWCPSTTRYYFGGGGIERGTASFTTSTCGRHAHHHRYYGGDGTFWDPTRTRDQTVLANNTATSLTRRRLP